MVWRVGGLGGGLAESEYSFLSSHFLRGGDSLAGWRLERGERGRGLNIISGVGKGWWRWDFFGRVGKR